MRKMLLIRCAGHSALVVKGEFHNHRNFNIAFPDATAAIIWMNVHDMKMLEDFFEEGFVESENECVEHSVDVVKLNDHDPEVHQHFYGGAEKYFIFRPFNIHL